MLLYILPLLFLLSTTTATDDILIRQVTTTPTTTHLLNATHQFTLFKTRYNKAYPTQKEHDHRFRIFKANLNRAVMNQALDPTAVHGVTRFSDLSPSEFQRQFLGLRGLSFPAHANKAQALPTDGLPKKFDWRDLGAVTPPKNQGGCGSCWSFSATGALEGAHFLANGKLESLSEQQLLDCDFECDPEGEPDDCDEGCSGGLMNNAFEYLVKAGGLMREEDYPYKPSVYGRNKCEFEKTKIAAKVANYSFISPDEDQIAANLVKYGPLTVGINAAYMSSYIGGVSCPSRCSTNLNHGVLMVGYDSHGYATLQDKEKSYWIIKNSWGENWGENGYYKICRGYNACGVDTLVSSITAETITSQ